MDEDGITIFCIFLSIIAANVILYGILLVLLVKFIITVGAMPQTEIFFLFFECLICCNFV